MLCEICHEKEATVRITRIHHGNSESHNLCQDCAKQYGAEDPEAQDLSKAIFKLLAGALMKHLGPQNQNSEENERAKKLAVILARLAEMLSGAEVEDPAAFATLVSELF